MSAIASTAHAPLLLRGGSVIDGTGAARLDADVRIENGRIAAIGAGLPANGADVIDVAGKIVAPGFIDVHTHDDQAVLSMPGMLPKIRQGVTTVVVGNCGISLAPLARERVPPPLNLIGNDYRHASMAAYAEAVRRCAWPRWTTLIGRRRAMNRLAWRRCCAKAWKTAR
jgi:N-acyl-D-amino-acid deacylase